MTTPCPWTRILTSQPRFDWDISDRGRRRQEKLLFIKWICVFSTFIAIIPTHLYCREKSMRTLLELNSYEPYSSSRKKKCDAHAKLFFCLLNLLVFWSSRSASSMEPKFSSLKLSADIPPKTFFRKLSTLESIVTGDEGKKPSDKKIIQQKTHKKSKFRCRKRRNWNI